MLGVCEYQTKEYDQAVAHLQQGLKLGLGENASLTHVARYHRAILLTHFGEFAAALQMFVILSADGIEDANAVAAARESAEPSIFAESPKGLSDGCHVRFGQCRTLRTFYLSPHLSSN